MILKILHTLCHLYSTCKEHNSRRTHEKSKIVFYVEQSSTDLHCLYAQDEVSLRTSLHHKLVANKWVCLFITEVKQVFFP